MLDVVTKKLKHKYCFPRDSNQEEKACALPLRHTGVNINERNMNPMLELHVLSKLSKKQTYKYFII